MHRFIRLCALHRLACATNFLIFFVVVAFIASLLPGDVVALRSSLSYHGDEDEEEAPQEAQDASRLAARSESVALASRIDGLRISKKRASSHKALERTSSATRCPCNPFALLAPISCTASSRSLRLHSIVLWRSHSEGASRDSRITIAEVEARVERKPHFDSHSAPFISSFRRGSLFSLNHSVDQ